VALISFALDVDGDTARRVVFHAPRKRVRALPITLNRLLSG
jgi:hypothetical protein